MDIMADSLMEIGNVEHGVVIHGVGLDEVVRGRGNLGWGLGGWDQSRQSSVLSWSRVRGNELLSKPDHAFSLCSHECWGGGHGSRFRLLDRPASLRFVTQLRRGLHARTPRWHQDLYCLADSPKSVGILLHFKRQRALPSPHTSPCPLILPSSLSPQSLPFVASQGAVHL